MLCCSDSELHAPSVRGGTPNAAAYYLLPGPKQCAGGWQVAAPNEKNEREKKRKTARNRVFSLKSLQMPARSCRATLQQWQGCLQLPV